MIGPSLLRSEVSPTVMADATESQMSTLSMTADALPRGLPASCDITARFPEIADARLEIDRLTAKGSALALPAICL
jgi:hypothetical protein